MHVTICYFQNRFILVSVINSLVIHVDNLYEFANVGSVWDGGVRYYRDLTKKFVYLVILMLVLYFIAFYDD